MPCPTFLFHFSPLQVTANRLQGALQRLEAVDQTVYELGQELGALQRRLAAAEQEVRQRMDLITAAKEKCVPLSFVHLFIVSLPNICLSVSVLCILYRYNTVTR